MFPYLLAEVTLPAAHQWKQNNATVVLSASANNSYVLKVASDNKWPLFIMNKGFSEDEIASWFKQENFFPGLDKSDAVYWTNSMPYLSYFALPGITLMLFTLELSYLLRIARENGGISGDTSAFDHVVSLYTTQRNIEYNMLQVHFEKQYCQTPADMEAHINTLVWMELGIEKYRVGQAYLLNQQFMFTDDNVVKPTTPLVQQFLVDRYVLSSPSSLPPPPPGSPLPSPRLASLMYFIVKTQGSYQNSFRLCCICGFQGVIGGILCRHKGKSV